MSSRGADDGVWQDREVRFDSLPGQLRCRMGEVTIDSINSVEDTKGNNGEKGYSEGPRKQDKAVPEDNSPNPHHDGFGSRKPTMAEVYRMFEEQFDIMDKNLDRMSALTAMLKTANTHLAGLEHEARQQRLFTEADGVEPDTKTRKRTKGASGTDQVVDVDSLLPRFDYGSTRLTSFSMIDGPPAPEKSVGDVLIDKGAEAPKPCISPAEIRTTTVTGSLMSTGTASSAMMIIFPPLPLWNFCPFEDMNFRATTSIQIYATHGSFRQMEVLETKSRQTLMLDPGGCTCLRACPFLGGWRASLCRGVFVWTPHVT